MICGRCFYSKSLRASHVKPASIPPSTSKQTHNAPGPCPVYHGPHLLTGVSFTPKLSLSHSAKTFCLLSQSSSGRVRERSKCQRIFASIRRISAYARLEDSR